MLFSNLNFKPVNPSSGELKAPILVVKPSVRLPEEVSSCAWMNGTSPIIGSVVTLLAQDVMSVLSTVVSTAPDEGDDPDEGELPGYMTLPPDTGPMTATPLPPEGASETAPPSEDGAMITAPPSDGPDEEPPSDEGPPGCITEVLEVPPPITT